MTAIFSGCRVVGGAAFFVVVVSISFGFWVTMDGFMEMGTIGGFFVAA